MFSFENLKVYQLARTLVKDVYLLQNKFPKEERYALVDQVRRAATSITANLAEGSGRQSVKEKIHFIEIAFGSMTEVFYELQTACDLNYIKEEGRMPCGHNLQKWLRCFQDFAIHSRNNFNL